MRNSYLRSSMTEIVRSTVVSGVTSWTFVEYFWMILAMHLNFEVLITVTGLFALIIKLKYPVSILEVDTYYYSHAYASSRGNERKSKNMDRIGHWLVLVPVLPPDFYQVHLHHNSTLGVRAETEAGYRVEN